MAVAAWAGVSVAGAQPAPAEPWVAPTSMTQGRTASILEEASAAADADTAATVLEALRRRPPAGPLERAEHHLLVGVAHRIAGRFEAAALSFLRAAVAGPPGGPLHGPAMLEAAITLRSIARTLRQAPPGAPDGLLVAEQTEQAEQAERAADRLLLEAEGLLIRDADPATLARFRTQRP